MRYDRGDLREMGRCPECGHDTDSCQCQPGRGRPDHNDRQRKVVFKVPGRPHGKQRPRLSVGDDGSPHAYQDDQTRQYERKVAHCAADAKPQLWRLDAKYRLVVIVKYSDNRVADLSNLIKAVEDGAEGVLWEDDRDIVRLKASRDVVEGRDEGFVLVIAEDLS